MARIFGTTPPAGGKTLREAALTFTSQPLRQHHEQAEKEATRVSAAKQYVVVDRVRTLKATSRTFQALSAEVLEKLRSGELQAIAMVLGVDPQYHELAAPHWRALTDISWRDSTVRRPVENSPLFHVLVYRREDYDKLVAAEMGKQRSTIVKVLRTNQTLGARIRDVYNATPDHIRNQWKTKTQAARWIRNHIDGGGALKGKRRYVLLELHAELAIQFPYAPDGVTEK